MLVQPRGELNRYRPSEEAGLWILYWGFPEFDDNGKGSGGGQRAPKLGIFERE